MKKIVLYPYDVSCLHLLLYRNMMDISDDDIIECISPLGWGYEGEDAGYKVGVCTGILVKSNFMSIIDDIDILVITESILSLPNIDIEEKINSVLACDKRVIVIRKIDAEFENHLAEKSNGNYNLEVYKGNQIKLYNDIEVKDTSIEEIPAPIILVLGSGERCCKFDVQLELRNALLEQGYTLTQIGSKNYCELFGFHSFPDFMLNHGEFIEREKIIGFNKYIKMLYMQENSDIIIVGIPGGVFPFDEYFNNDFGIMSFYVSTAIVPDYVIFCSLYVDALAEYLKTMKMRFLNRYGYEIDQIFISNYALNYLASKSDQRLTYLTYKTPSLLEKVRELNVYNIYDNSSRKDFVHRLISMMQDYADIFII